MRKLINIIFIYTALTLFVACGGGQNEVQIDNPKSDPIIIPEKINQEIKYVHNDPFYPMKDKIEDLEFKLDQLRAQVLEYESKLHAPTLNLELLKLIKAPNIQHEVIMDNGTIIQGKIIQENSEKLIIETRIGQLPIDKTKVYSINEVKPLSPNIIFDEQSIEERLSENNKSFSGSIVNTGGRRADFVRVIYKLWGPTNDFPSLIDSIFISGNTIVYNNGVISDACLNPGESATFSLSIDIPDTLDISHWTKEVGFDVFD